MVVLSQELTTVNPQVRLRIKGLSASDIPYVVYNNKSYPLTKLGMDEFMTAPLEANENDSELSVLVGDKVIDRCSILWKKAAQEEELIRLREQNAEQEKQLKNLSVNAADMLTKQSQLQQGLLEQQNRPSVHASGADIREALKELKREFDGVDDSEAGEKIRSWIEQG